MNTAPVAAARIAFATCAWERDWRVVLDEARFAAQVASSRHDYAPRLIVLNNFAGPASREAALLQARGLVSAGLADEILDAPAALTDTVLKSFGLKADWFWKRNPYFSTAHLALLHYLRGRADRVFFLNGDVWLERPCAWVPRALAALTTEPRVLGLNLCRNIYRDLYARDGHRETADLWISDSAWQPGGGARCGFALSDHAYLLPLAREWNFACTDEEVRHFGAGFPAYATPCFELFFCAAMRREGFAYAALKPAPGPMTKHKSFPKNAPFRTWLYRALGNYRLGGKWATARE